MQLNANKKRFEQDVNKIYPDMLLDRQLALLKNSIEADILLRGNRRICYYIF